MKLFTAQNLRLKKIAFTFLIFLLLLPTFAFSEETYVFEHMWPTLQQPWYFDHPNSVTVDNSGSVYVSSYAGIHKLNSNGQFITRINIGSVSDLSTDLNGHLFATIGRFDSQWFDGNGAITIFDSNGAEFLNIQDWDDTASQRLNPVGISVDSDGFFYVTDVENHCVYKFNPEGQRVLKWGSQGNGEGQFYMPHGIDIDSEGNLWVVDSGNHRVQKFSRTGEFLGQWGSNGQGDGQFEWPHGISIDISGNVFVSEGTGPLGGPWSSSHKIQKFDANFSFIKKWGTFGQNNGDMRDPMHVAVDNDGKVYLADIGNHRLQVFSNDGEYLTKWGASGTEPSYFMYPRALTVHPNGNLIVADTMNNRLQIFNQDGSLVDIWGDSEGEATYYQPSGVDVDSAGNIYVAAWNHVKKIDVNGHLLLEWGGLGSGDGQFDYALDLAVDANDNIYVVDSNNARIQKFTSTGTFISKWGSPGTGNGQFQRPGRIAIDTSDRIYVNNWWGNEDYVQIFDTEGDFLYRWDFGGFAVAIACDDNGHIYVTHNQLIEKYDSNRNLITSWSTTGNSIVPPSTPEGITVNNSEEVYICANTFQGVMKFKKVIVTENTKAIIVAGGGPFPGNNLWNATQMVANFGYRTLTYKGFTKETIHYLSSDSNLDLDSNGVIDDVDGDATNGNLKQSITNWAADAENLVVYIVDHGGNGTFRMSASETLSASELDAWLDQLQESTPCKITVVYDACESGSFIPALTPPEGKERIVIGSTSPGESAYFVTQGSVSFSSYFWTHVFNGLDIKNAFNLASESIQYTTNFQHPLIDANGDGTSNQPDDFTLAENKFIGNGTVIPGDAPVISGVSADQTISDTSSALLSASGVMDNDGIARVWAVIKPPGYYQGASCNPVSELPSIDLMPVGGDQYEITYDGFNIAGTYHIVIYARDRIGNTSVLDIALDVVLKGDVNGDGKVGLPDTVVCLKAIAGLDVSAIIRPGYVTSGVDVNNNGSIGIEEAIYSLQGASELR